jgi:hypothetical protein
MEGLRSSATRCDPVSDGQRAFGVHYCGTSGTHRPGPVAAAAIGASAAYCGNSVPGDLHKPGHLPLRMCTARWSMLRQEMEACCVMRGLIEFRDRQDAMLQGIRVVQEPDIDWRGIIKPFLSAAWFSDGSPHAC